MITKQDNIQAEIIACIEDSYERYPNSLISKEECLELLEKAFADQLNYEAAFDTIKTMRLAIQEANNALSTCKEFIQDAHIVEAQWSWEPVKEASAAMVKLKPFIP